MRCPLVAIIVVVVMVVVVEGDALRWLKNWLSSGVARIYLYELSQAGRGTSVLIQGGCTNGLPPPFTVNK
jgi:hypothetical protein